MSFEFEWLFAGRVLVAHVRGRLTDADTVAFDVTIAELLGGQTRPPVHLLIDYSGLECIELEISPTVEPHAPTAVHPKLGLRAAVGSPMLRFLPVYLQGMLRPPASVYVSREQALDSLRAADPSLGGDWLRSATLSEAHPA